MKLSDKVSYIYIKHIKKWIECPICHKKMILNKQKMSWVCNSCNYKILEKDFVDDFVFWFCDECNTYLNNQEGFDRHSDKHICTKCGYENDTTFDNVKGECKDCGLLLTNPDATLCDECKKERLKKAEKWLLTASAVIGAVSTAVNSQNSTNDTNTPPTSYSFDDNFECANCGNTNKDTLWDEGDTIYCSLCCHRTRTSDGEDDLVECPHCHEMRDCKAYYCRHCNTPF